MLNGEERQETGVDGDCLWPANRGRAHPARRHAEAADESDRVEKVPKRWRSRSVVCEEPDSLSMLRRCAARLSWPWVRCPETARSPPSSRTMPQSRPDPLSSSQRWCASARLAAGTGSSGDQASTGSLTSNSSGEPDLAALDPLLLESTSLHPLRRARMRDVRPGPRRAFHGALGKGPGRDRRRCRRGGRFALWGSRRELRLHRLTRCVIPNASHACFSMAPTRAAIFKEENLMRSVSIAPSSRSSDWMGEGNRPSPGLHLASSFREARRAGGLVQ